ncbi:unnamed protein product [Soboliphyme baturini]|uniref:ANK_REP_REGION domain-containing protein n=1 Tax=Soboliphyme baturini TaxID=241478 RepID=A0A183I9I0_9BILA|nr:unnamed protein product [Soboliphyme baturini]
MMAVVSEKAELPVSKVHSFYNRAVKLAEVLKDKMQQAIVYRDWKLYLEKQETRDISDRDLVYRRAEELCPFLDEGGSSSSPALIDDSHDEDLPNGIEITSSSSCSSEESNEEMEKSEEWKCVKVRRQGYTVKKNPLGESELHVAAINNDIKTHHPLDITDNAGWSPLHEASNKGFTGIVEMLLNAGANVNFIGCDGVTPLMDAASNGHLDVMNLLLKAGASTYMRDSQHLRAFDYLEEWEKSNSDCLDGESAAVLQNLKEQLQPSSRNGLH